MSTDSLGPETDRAKGKGFIAAGVFLGVIVVLGVIALVGSHGSSGSSGSAAPAQTGAASSASEPTASSSGGPCRLAASAASVSSSAPTDVTWSLYDTVALPSSPASGPGSVDGDVASCYAHSEEGALIASAQLSVRYLLAADWRAVLDANVVSNAGASKYAAARAQVTMQAGSSQSNGFGQIAAYAFQAYTPQTAVVELVWRFQDGSMQMTPVTLEWSGGDWKLALEPTGAVGAGTQSVANLLGYNAWGGV